MKTGCGKAVAIIHAVALALGGLQWLLHPGSVVLKSPALRRCQRATERTWRKRFELEVLCVLVLLFAATACSTVSEGPFPRAAEPARPEPPQASSPPSAGPAVLGPSDYVTLDLKDVDLHEALKTISRQVGVNILADPEVTERVTLQLDRVPWGDAIAVIARQAKCTIVQESERLVRLSQLPSISMEFQDADIKTVLQLLAKQAGVNIIYGSDIEGKVTLNLREVPWVDALEAVVRTAGYVVVHEGGSSTTLRVMRP
jgi:type II secretory pathway component GspD/PulD (secretin)